MMNPSDRRPDWVIEQVLDASPFHCCGDEDLFPFKCSTCARPAVLCYECDTLFSDLPDLSVRLPFVWGASRCPDCGVTFGSDLMRSPDNRISFAEWHRRGLEQLLVDCSPEELIRMLADAAEAISGFLRRGMLSTAKTRLIEFRNLAEAIAALVSDAEDVRARGREIASRTALWEALAWHATLTQSADRAYAVLGITDALFPAV